MKLGLAIISIAAVTVGARAILAIGGIDKAPAPSVPHAVNFAKPKEANLANGLRVIVVERPGLPLIAAQLLVRSGAEVDPENLGGTASMAGSLLTKGTEKMSAPQIASAIESLGGSIFSGGSWDSSTAGVAVMSDKAAAALEILSDVVLHPTFAQGEIDRLKKPLLDGLRVALQQPNSLGTYAATRVLYPAGEYAHPAGGTMESLQGITRDGIVKLYKPYYRPDNAVLMIVGNVTMEQGKNYAQQFFGEWKSDQSVPPPKPAQAEGSPWKPQTLVIDMPQAGQAAVTILKPAIKRDSPDFYTGVVANAALGQGFASRLNREIRIKRGLSYGATSSLNPRRDAGSFGAGAQTKNESAAEVAKLLQVEAVKLGTQPAEGDELKSRQAMLIGGFARSMETNFGVAGQISNLAVHNLPLGTLDKFIPSINAVTAKDEAAFAKKYFAGPSSIVIAGKAPAFIEALKKDVPDVRVIPQGDLDLNRADLTKQK